MRWLFSALVLCAATVLAVTAKRVVGFLGWFASEPTDEPALLAVEPPRADDTLGPAETLPPRAFEPRGAPSVGQPSEVGETPDETSRRARRAPPPNPNRDVPEPTLSPDALGRGSSTGAKRTSPDLADPAAQVEGLAREVAPKLAAEVREHAADMDRNPEVEHELLETLKEQQQILAGKRDTVDSVLEKSR
jgi:hypothetical protein